MSGEPSSDLSGNDPPMPVHLIGSKTTWTEAEWHRRHPAAPKHPSDCRCGCRRPGAVAESPRIIAGRDDCPNGCKYRNLAREYQRGLDRTCLRCYTNSRDPAGWWIARPGTIAAPSPHKGRIKLDVEAEETQEEQAA